MAEINDLSVTDGSNTARFPENMVLNAVNDGARALEGIIARGLKDTVDGIITTGGSPTAYTAAANRTLSAYYDGLQLTVEFHTASGATPTLNVDSVGAQSLVWPDGTAVSATEIPANLFAKVIYDETNTNWIVLTTTGLALVAGDIGSTVQAYDADTSKLDVAETRSASLNFADQEAIRPKLKDYGETVNVIGSIGGGTQDIDLELGNVVTGTVDTGETTFTFSNPSASGTACSFTLILTNGGSQTVNWPASVDWPGGAAPSLTASGVDVISFYTTDGGTTWYGVSALNFS
jgi:hypothetical protein